MVHGYAFKLANRYQRWRRLPSFERCEVLAKIRVSQGRFEDRQRLTETHLGHHPSTPMPRSQCYLAGPERVLRVISKQSTSSEEWKSRTVCGRAVIQTGSHARSRHRIRTPTPDSSRYSTPLCSLKSRRVSSPRVVMTRVDQASCERVSPRRGCHPLIPSLVSGGPTLWEIFHHSRLRRRSLGRSRRSQSPWFVQKPGWGSRPSAPPGKLDDVCSVHSRSHFPPISSDSDASSSNCDVSCTPRREATASSAMSVTDISPSGSVDRLTETVCNVASSREAGNVADARSAALASFSTQVTHVF
jgi:hypothetical protein